MVLLGRFGIEPTRRKLIQVAFPLLARSLAKNRQDGIVFFASQAFLDGNDLVEIQHLNLDRLGDPHPARMREQVNVRERVTNGGEQIERAEPSQEIQMAFALKMCQVRPQLTVRLDAKYRVDAVQDGEQPLDVFGVVRVDDIDIVRLDRGALQDCGQAADEDEFGAAFLERREAKRELTRLH